MQLLLGHTNSYDSVMIRCKLSLTVAAHGLLNAAVNSLQCLICAITSGEYISALYVPLFIRLTR